MELTLELIYFILAAHGLTQIIVYGSIFDAIRPDASWLKGFGQLFNCSMCMGFWVGVFLFGINKFTELFNFEYTWANLLILGCLSSGTSYMLNVLFAEKEDPFNSGGMHGNSALHDEDLEDFGDWDDK